MDDIAASGGFVWRARDGVGPIPHPRGLSDSSASRVDVKNIRGFPTSYLSAYARFPLAAVAIPGEGQVMFEITLVSKCIVTTND